MPQRRRYIMFLFALTSAVLDQAVRYHAALRPKYLLLFNGETAYCYEVGTQALQPMDHLPEYVEMLD